MASKVPVPLRDQMITHFRGVVCEKMGVIPLEHQAEWWAATDGLLLLKTTAADGEGGVVVRLGDRSLEKRQVLPRPFGRARVVADLGSFKVGKSFGVAIWAAAFASVPGARVQLVGSEYDICEPEFNYICEALLSERGLGLQYDSLQNRPRDGKMWIDFPNGMRYEAKSWERKDSMKGKEIDAYVYCEAYQLPGIECYTEFKQNLVARDGYAIFPTTPDRPWVKELHDRAHSGEPEFKSWHCTCSVPRAANPDTFSAEQRDADRKLMTTEKFLIHWEGQLGNFVGRVFDYQRGQREFNPGTHPALFRRGSAGGREDFILPAGWEVVGGIDTGTYSSALFIAFSPDEDAFVLDEVPNYKYVGGKLELLPEMTIPRWQATIKAIAARYRMERLGFWADANSQFRWELQNNYGITLFANKQSKEARTEIAREYFFQGKVWFAPWLVALPFELENAAWPEEASMSGRFERVKDRDHTLDPFEHVLSRRPRGVMKEAAVKHSRWIDQYAAQSGARRKRGNRHLGVN